MSLVIDKHEISFGCVYLLLVVLATFVIKAIMSFVRVLQNDKEISRATPAHWWDEIKEVDYVVALGIGTIEIFIYPLLIYSGAWQSITWWLGIKTAARWRWRPRKKPKDPADDEKTSRRYTNFLFGNALVILAALLLTPLVNK